MALAVLALAPLLSKAFTKVVFWLAAAMWRAVCPARHRNKPCLSRKQLQADQQPAVHMSVMVNGQQLKELALKLPLLCAKGCARDFPEVPFYFNFFINLLKLTLQIAKKNSNRVHFLDFFPRENQDILHSSRNKTEACEIDYAFLHKK